MKNLLNYNDILNEKNQPPVKRATGLVDPPNNKRATGLVDPMPKMPAFLKSAKAYEGNYYRTTAERRRNTGFPNCWTVESNSGYVNTVRSRKVYAHFFPDGDIVIELGEPQARIKKPTIRGVWNPSSGSEFNFSNVRIRGVEITIDEMFTGSEAGDDIDG